LKRRPPTFKKNISSKESEELIDERSKQKVFTDSEIKEITNVWKLDVVKEAQKQVLSPSESEEVKEEKP